MPGCARASSRWDQALGATLIVATADGAAPPALDAVRAFLDARRASVPLVLCGPTPKRLRVDVEVDPDPAYLVEIVKNGLADLCQASTLRRRECSRSLRASWAARVRERALLAAQGVAGVIGVRVTAFCAVGIWRS